MRMRKALPMVVVLILAAATAAAENLYRWIDSQGVQRYSNLPPPPDVEKYEVLEGERDPSSAGQERVEFQRMMERVEQENRRNEELARQKELKRATEERRKAEAELQTRIQRERQILEQQIEEINRRALGPRFTPGMRQAQIDEIQKKIDALEEQGRQ